MKNFLEKVKFLVVEVYQVKKKEGNKQPKKKLKNYKLKIIKIKFGKGIKNILELMQIIKILIN